MLSFRPSSTRSCLRFRISLLFLSRKLHGNETQPRLPKPPNISELVTERDTEEAQAWATQFVNIKVPKDVVEFSFSRSSGPGGQVIVFWTVFLWAISFLHNCINFIERE